MTQPTPQPNPTPYYAPAAAPARTNTLAIVALILGIIVPIAGVITGHIALNQVKKTGEAGHGLALAGTIIGYVLSACWIVFWILYVIFIVFAINTGISSYNDYNY